LDANDSSKFQNLIRTLNVQTGGTTYSGTLDSYTFSSTASSTLPNSPNSAITYYSYTGLSQCSKVGFWVANTTTPTSYSAHTYSEFIQFINNGQGCLSDPIHIAWLNKNGAWDTYTLDKRALESKSVDRQIYAQSGIRNAPYFTQQSSERRKVIYEQDLTEVMTVSTWYLRQEEYPIIEDIILSTDVYIIKKDETGYYNYLLPVVVQTNSVTEFKDRYGKIVQYQFNLEYSPINEQFTQG
jgi:hypothetical protein